MDKNYIWKWGGVVLVLYSLLAGLLMPMKPGVVFVDKTNVEGGKTEELSIKTYNTFYDQEEAMPKAWLKTGSNQFLEAIDVLVIDEVQLKASFDLPSLLPEEDKMKDLTLVLSDEKNGTLVLPSAVFFRPADNDLNEGTRWEAIAPGSFHQTDMLGIPFRNLLLETIRNLYYHVSMWFAMVVILVLSLYHSVAYLRTNNVESDFKATAYTMSGIVLGILGLATGAVWATYTWGEPWSGDVKQNMSAVAILIYCAYFVLRNSFSDSDKSRRVAAAYNIFAFVCMIPLLFVIPRMQSSLHPGSGGNPGFGGEDLDSTMRMVFYPAVVGWILIFLWVSNIIWRVQRIEWKKLNA